MKFCASWCKYTKYTLKYAMDGHPVYKIGVNFSTATYMPNEWLTVEA
ncbi:MAG: hypothetical protein ACRCUJ_13105 [Phocaeicola sp.]